MTEHDIVCEAGSRFLSAGFLAPALDRFSARLVSAGYTTLTIIEYQRSIAHFGTWLGRRGFVVNKISPEVMAEFASHRCTCPGSRSRLTLSRRYVARVWRFIDYLNEQGLVDCIRERPKHQHPTIVDEFGHWLRDHRGVCASTVDRYSDLVVLLLPTLGSDPAAYDAAKIRRAVTNQAHRYSRATVQRFVTALRAYLRFLISTGKCRSDLVMAVPTIPQWKLSTLPRYLVDRDIERVVTAYDGDTRCGLRNRAVLLLLARLGLRAGDIVNLCLSDIDWDDGTLCVSGKGRRAVRLPLPQEAGDALLAYLQQQRPPIPVDRVFLCVQAPYRALGSSPVVSGIVRGALARAGIVNPPSKGTNLLRHSAATSLLRSGATLDAVSSLLRHRSLDTTAHYAKVDIKMLRTVVQPWPQEDAPC